MYFQAKKYLELRSYVVFYGTISSQYNEYMYKKFETTEECNIWTEHDKNN